MSLTSLSLTASIGASIWVGNCKITVKRAKGNRVLLQFEAPQEVRILRGSLIIDEHEYRESSKGPYEVQERLDCGCWDDVFSYVELAEASQAAELGASNGATSRVIDEKRREVYRPAEQCQVCEGDGELICSMCSGIGTMCSDTGDGLGGPTCLTCNGRGSVQCETCHASGKC